MFLRRGKSKAQSMTEYAVLIAVIVAALIAIQIYMKRSVMGRLKQSSDDIGEQFSTKASYSLQTVQQSGRRETTGKSTTNFANSTILSRDETESGWVRNVGNEINASIAPILSEDYYGHETTQRDYVNTTTGRQLGAHGEQDLGNVSNEKLFE